jgi:hypothetical protein
MRPGAQGRPERRYDATATGIWRGFVECGWKEIYVPAFTYVSKPEFHSLINLKQCLILFNWAFVLIETCRSDCLCRFYAAVGSRLTEKTVVT